MPRKARLRIATKCAILEPGGPVILEVGDESPIHPCASRWRDTPAGCHSRHGGSLTFAEIN
jgi:hypothetical protein